MQIPIANTCTVFHSFYLKYFQKYSCFKGSITFYLLHVFSSSLVLSAASSFESVITYVLCVSLPADLTHIPSDLPSDIVKMDLSHNSITHLRPKQFLLSKDLKLLNLSNNNLEHIDKGNSTSCHTPVHIHLVTQTHCIISTDILMSAVSDGLSDGWLIQLCDFYSNIFVVF